MHNNTLLIILAAVVVLIVIVVLTGMRYLRADDEEDFDDLPAEPARSKRDGQAVGRSRSRERTGQDWREEDGRRGREDRPARGGQPQRPSRPARRGQQDTDEQDAVRTRAGRPAPVGVGQRGSDEYDERPARMVPTAREYETGQSRNGRAAGSLRDQDIRTGREDRDLRSGARADSRADDRRRDSGQGRRDESLPAVRPRQSRGKRDSEGDWPSTEWDDLSDVDYWAELASDKPLTTTAQPAASAHPERPDAPRDSENGDGQARNRRPGGTPRDRGSKLPVRQARQPVPANQAGPGVRANSGEFDAIATRRSAAPAGEPTLAMLANMTPQNDARSPGLADDDPLTSPSFPRIGAEDSRSYRRHRSDAAGQDARLSDSARLPDSAARTHQLVGYPAVTSGHQIGGMDGQDQRGATPPGGYARPGGSGPDYAAASTADPYRPVPSGGSRSAGQPAVASAAGPSYPAGSGSYPAQVSATFVPPVGAGNFPTATASTGGYAAGASSSYPAAAAGYARGTDGTRGYSVPAGNLSGYPAAVSPSYPAVAGSGGYAASTAAGSAGGYAVSTPASGAGGYPPASAGPADYSPDSSTIAYSSPTSTGNSYPAASMNAAYPAAGSAGAVGAEQSLSYPSYLPGGPAIGGGAGWNLPTQDALQQQTQPQASQPADGYRGFPTGPAGQFPGGSAAAYPPAVPQLPGAAGNASFGGGYPVGPLHPAETESYQVGQFHAAPYEPPGYPPATQETGGYAGGDPYAMDPYGYPGYGNGGF